MKPPTLIAIIVLLLIPLGVFIAYKGDKSNTMEQKTSASPTPKVTDEVSAKQVIVKTDKGGITLNLYPDKAPLAVKNFVTLGKRGYYNGVIFHRVIKGFMDQAGDPTGTGGGGESIYGKYFKTEITDQKFVTGVLGAARTNQMDTNGSQFFIMAADTHSLDNQYTAFGKVADVASQEVVNAINNVATDPSNDKPLEAIKITGFEITQE